MKHGIYNVQEVINERYVLPGCDTRSLVDICRRFELPCCLRPQGYYSALNMENLGFSDASLNVHRNTRFHMHGDTSNVFSTHCDIIKMPHLAPFVRGFLCYEDIYLNALVNPYQFVPPSDRDYVIRYSTF